MTTDLERQVRDYVQHADAQVELVSIDELAARADAVVSLSQERVDFRRGPGLGLGWGAAIAAAVATVIAIGGALWLVRSAPSGEVVNQPDLPVPSVSSPPIPAEPETATPTGPPPPATTVPGGAALPEASDVVDYGEVAERIGTMAGPLGPIEWWSARRVPVAWVNEGGFPSPSFTFKTSWIPLYEAAPEGVEIFEVAGGYVGLTTVTDAEEYAERDRRMSAMWYGALGSPPIFPEAVWFSPDGEWWKLMLDGPIEPAEYSVETHHDPDVLAEHDGRFVLVGWVNSVNSGVRYFALWDENGNQLEGGEGAVFLHADHDGNPLLDEEDSPILTDEKGNPVDPGDVVNVDGNPVDVLAALNNDELSITAHWPDRGRPMAWVTDDLLTWERVAADFEKPGMITDLESVVVSDAGWFIFGVRRTDTSDGLARRAAEWAAWASPDGKVWEELPIGDLFDPPEECTPSQGANCIRMRGAPAPGGGVAVYAYEWDEQVSDFRDLTWELRIAFPG